MLEGRIEMNCSKIVRGIFHRWTILHLYAAATPTIIGLASWLELGALSCRLFGGSGRARPTLTGRPRNRRLPIGSKRGQSVIVDIASFDELLALREVIVDKIYPLHRVDFQPTMILDCGANVGYFASLARVEFPESKIICWEPDDKNYYRLISQPLLRGSKVICVKAAVSDVDGEADLTGAGIGCRLENSKGSSGQLVKTINLPQWIDRNCNGSLVIKMDIEGHERKVLHALKGHWVSPCILFLETHEEGGNDTDITNELIGAGFQVEHIRAHSQKNDARIFKEYICQRLA
jgi:FkbM family methyltransferase